MPTWKPLLDLWFQNHLGVINARQLTDFGCSTRTITRMVARGELSVLQHGVYGSRQWPDSRARQLVALCAMGMSIAIGFTTACTLWGYRGILDKRIHLLTPHAVSPEIAGVIVHRCRRIDPVDLVLRPDGILVTSPPRSLFDSADLLGVRAARSVMEQILHEKLCTLGTINDTFIRLAHPNRPGSRTMAEVIASRPAWRSALHSDLEVRVLAEVERQHLPAPTTQCPVDLPTGRTIHLDFGWPEWKVGLEVDDPTWHDGFEERHRDMGRDRKAGTVGWLVPRVSKIDVSANLADAVGDVSEILRQRGAKF